MTIKELQEAGIKEINKNVLPYYTKEHIAIAFVMGLTIGIVIGEIAGAVFV